MKKSIYISFGLLLAFLFASCQEKVTVPKSDNDTNKWVYDQVKEHYLWSSTLPGYYDTDRGYSPNDYFDTFLRYRTTSRNQPYANDTYGDRFSYVVQSSSTRSGDYPVYAAEETANDFGFNYIHVTDGNKENPRDLYLLVRYVVPGSPAEKAGIKRGECINAINYTNFPLSINSVVSLLASNSVDLQIIYPQKRIVQGLTRASYTNNPILYSDIYDVGAKVGYVVYNHFTSGSNKAFTTELQNIFAGFKSAGVRDLIFDMRYNQGGELTAAVDVATMMAPKSWLGKAFIYMERNRSYGIPSDFSAYYFSDSGTAGSYNLSPQNIYFITSEYTASASELLIHGFQAIPETNVLVVGEKTVGKNLATITVSSSSYSWEIIPVTGRIYDCNYVSDYESGIPSDINEQEYGDISWGSDNLPRLYTLGDIGDRNNEKLLKATLQIIEGTTRADVETTAPAITNMVAPRLQHGLTEGRIVVD